MQIAKAALVLGLGLGLAAPPAGEALAQAGSGSQPGIGQNQAPPPQQNRPQSDSRTGMTPQPATANLREYAALLTSAQQQLQTAVERSGHEPAANDQGAVTPAWMDLKAAAQAAYEAVRRVPADFRNDPLYENAERQIRQDLGVITQSMRPENGREAARKVLADMQAYTQEVSRRAQASPG
ncbi:hypothetical protein [Roseomonas marmotae]|uniref:DUF4168 domain-containing protein n=1 Tax=Roseomonas marmotae TaxID=2768161 RepID=A0ABS3K8R7_9PROT|nr:hypothetical protein [Roseomonas marmotae]MBO1073008.1 hypothetical protein [Roseomonas marmotae]QTI79344.1 hypothetical protein IAI58_00440 [Roseomonas marmotae]